MAKTSAEKMRDYRKRMREKGGKELHLIMSHEEMVCLAKLQELNFPTPDTDLTGIVRFVISHSLERIITIHEQQLKLIELGSSNETVMTYTKNEVERWKPLTAEQFLQQEAKQ